MNWNIKGNQYIINDDFPISIRPMDIPEFEDIINKTMESINKSDSMRLVVLETWFLTDYFIRKALYTAFSLSSYECEALDVKNDLLPKSFDECLTILQKIMKSQRELPSPPLGVHHVFYHYKFLNYIQQTSPELAIELLEKIEEAEHLYIKGMAPELYNDMQSEYYHILGSEHGMKIGVNYRNVSFYEFHKNIDDKWIKEARKVNEARNKAAHYHSEKEILRKLGLNETENIQKVKEHCLNIIAQICNIKNSDLSEDKTNG